MAEEFDPYRIWLGIPPEEQPPHHYRLLGIGLWESDADVVENAADRQMTHVQTHRAGKHSALSQRLLNELAGAKLCLLNPKNKAAYDGELAAKLNTQSALPPQAAPPPQAGAPPQAAPQPAALPQPAAPPHANVLPVARAPTMPPRVVAAVVPAEESSPTPIVKTGAASGHRGAARRYSQQRRRHKALFLVILIFVVAVAAVLGMVFVLLKSKFDDESADAPASNSTGKRPASYVIARGVIASRAVSCNDFLVRTPPCDNSAIGDWAFFEPPPQNLWVGSHVESPQLLPSELVTMISSTRFFGADNISTCSSSLFWSSWMRQASIFTRSGRRFQCTRFWIC